MGDQTTRRLGKSGHMTACGAARLLSLAAAPTFAVMAVIAVVAPSDMLCAATDGPLSLSGMVPMYVLMSAFHLAPWLRLVR